MKRVLVLSILVAFAAQAYGETVGRGGSWMYSDDEEVKPAPRKPAPPRPPAPVPIPVPSPVQPVIKPPSPNPRPQAEVPKPPAPTPAPVQPPQLTEVPFKASVAIGSTRCPSASAHPNARNTPVKVFVDQHSQSVRIESPDRPKPLESIVSTGGGLKIPNGSIKKGPYCARTPRKERLIVSAVTPDMFAGTGCTEDEIRAKSTVFPMYHTRTFTDKNNNPIPMPNAVRITGGIFFHEVPPSYRELLGHNVSGECVRLKPSVAKFLRQQITKYGAIEVNITEPPQVAREMPQYCDDRMVADARLRQSTTGSQIAAAPLKQTGTEDVQGGQENFFTILGRIFNPHQNPVARTQQPRSGPRG